MAAPGDESADVSSSAAPAIPSATQAPATHSQSAAPPAPRRLLNQFALGLTWLGVVAWIVANLTGPAFVLVLFCLLTGSLGLGGLTAWWVVERVSKTDFRLGRFSIASLLFLTVVVGVFLASVRWLVLATAAKIGHVEPFSPLVYLGAGFVAFLVALISSTLVVSMLDSLVWLALWWLRRSRRH